MPSLSLAFDAAVFDCDGTLVQTKECWRQAYQRVAGDRISDELMDELAGASTRLAARKLSERFNRSFSPSAIANALADAVGEGPLAPLDGVVELLEFLQERGIPIAVATNGPKRFAEAVLGESLVAFFHRIVASEELPGERDKPEPDVYLEALRELGGTSPTRAIAFEDAKIGALSANAAGIPLVLVSADLKEPPAEVECRIFIHSLADQKLYDLLEGRLTDEE